MCKNKHLSLDDRLIIERELSLGKSFKYIGNLINKDCTTISREGRNYLEQYPIFLTFSYIFYKYVKFLT